MIGVSLPQVGRLEQHIETIFTMTWQALFTPDQFASLKRITVTNGNPFLSISVPSDALRDLGGGRTAKAAHRRPSVYTVDVSARADAPFCAVASASSMTLRLRFNARPEFVEPRLRLGDRTMRATMRIRAGSEPDIRRPAPRRRTVRLHQCAQRTTHRRGPAVQRGDAETKIEHFRIISRRPATGCREKTIAERLPPCATQQRPMSPHSKRLPVAR